MSDLSARHRLHQAVDALVDAALADLPPNVLRLAPHQPTARGVVMLKRRQRHYGHGFYHILAGMVALRDPQTDRVVLPRRPGQDLYIPPRWCVSAYGRAEMAPGAASMEAFDRVMADMAMLSALRRPGANEDLVLYVFQQMEPAATHLGPSQLADMAGLSREFVSRVAKKYNLPVGNRR